MINKDLFGDQSFGNEPIVENLFKTMVRLSKMCSFTTRNEIVDRLMTFDG